jgi:hypothetical protein
MPRRSSRSIANRNIALCRHAAQWIALGLALVMLAGCTSLGLPTSLVWPWDKERTKPPTRMTDMWSFTVLEQTGQAGVRGYGGRLMFYDAEDKPMKVDGTLSVYAFDARSEDPTKATPERKFVFLPRDLPKHYSESKLGHSYSFWLPWDEVGGAERQIVLATRFESKDGEVLLASPSRQILPGAKPNANRLLPVTGTAEIKLSPANDVRPASYLENLPEGVPSRGIGSTTINLPPSFVRQSLSSAQPMENQNGAVPPKNDSPAVPATATPPSPATAKGAVKAQAPPANGSAASADPTLQAESSARFALPRFPARREVTVGPRIDPVRRQPLPGQWPSALPTTPRSGWSREAADSPQAVATEPTAVSPPAAQNTRN